MAVDITALYCCLDDFCKLFADWEAHRLLPSEQTRQRPGKLSRAEMLFIVVLFHLSPFKHFKAFYCYGIGQQDRACFGDLPHYDRFVSLMPRLFAPLMVLLHSLSGEPSGVYFADSTKLAVCHNRRIHRHEVFERLAARGKTSMGWFYGLKLHFVINHKGQVMALKITPGNTADSTVLDAMTQHLAAFFDDVLKACDDRGARLRSRPFNCTGGGLDKFTSCVRVLSDKSLSQDIAAGGQCAEQLVIGQQQIETAGRHRLVAVEIGQYCGVDLLEPQYMLGARRRHRHQGHLFDLGRAEAVALQEDVDHELVMGAQGVDRDLLADQIARPLDCAARRYVEPGPVSLSVPLLPMTALIGAPAATSRSMAL